MTLLVGVRGKDGIALGADQKVMRGGEPSYAPKIHIVNDVLFATEGLTGLADDFLFLLQQEAALKKGFTTLYEAKTVAEDVVSELTKRYNDRLRPDENYMGVILAGLEDINKGSAKMYYVHPQGYGETVSFSCNGSGGPYATSLAKFILNESETVDENARRIAYVIHWVSESVDTYVGGTPQVAILRDQKLEPEWLGDEEIKKQGEAARSCQNDLWVHLCK